MLSNLGKPDRSIWQKRLNEMAGIDPKELSRLHGELIAFDWIEQNPTRTISVGSIPAGIYRITAQGVRDLCQVPGVEHAEKPETPDRVRPVVRSRKRKQKSADALAVDGAVQAQAAGEAGSTQIESRAA
jgi:hypothetical protein